MIQLIAFCRYSLLSGSRRPLMLLPSILQDPGLSPLYGGLTTVAVRNPMFIVNAARRSFILLVTRMVS